MTATEQEQMVAKLIRRHVMAETDGTIVGDDVAAAWIVEALRDGSAQSR